MQRDFDHGVDIGREFTLDQLKPLSEDTSDDRLFEVLEEALAARVIEELPQSVGRYQFTHALIQETLAEELSLTRRVRLHARIAEALEEMYGDDADAHAAELAHHFAQAEAMVGTEKLVRYSLVAGERALANYAWEEAQAHFQRGLAAKDLPLEGDYPARDSDEAALLFGGLALATAPATTVLVLKENHSEGPLTEFTTGLVVLNNLASIIIFELLFVLVHATRGANVSILAEYVELTRGLAVATLLGMVSGTAISFFLRDGVAHTLACTVNRRDSSTDGGLRTDAGSLPADVLDDGRHGGVDVRRGGRDQRGTRQLDGSAVRRVFCNPRRRDGSG